MLKRIDRLQMAVPDRAEVASRWRELLGAELAGEDRVASLGALRTRLRLGNGFVELLEPDGAGRIGHAVAERGAHLYAAGVATDDVSGLVAHLRSQGIDLVEEGGQVFVDPPASGDVGFRVVVSPHEELEPVGDIDFFYETTLLVDDATAAAERCAAFFALDPDAFVPIDSQHFGYAGTLTLFDPDRLGRFEVITPNDPGKTMGRFFSRFGEAFYMAFAESSALGAIEARARELGAGHTSDPPAEGRAGPANTV
ncbi:MAG: VOC family protein, partial [Deltaproteobacteria bacterium]|nr:VOC family protein [Deltaproteobacteria bacterium]